MESSPRLQLNVVPRNAEEAERLAQKRKQLEFIAHKAGFPSWQKMAVHLLDRIVAKVGDRVTRRDVYPFLDEATEEVAQRAVEAIERLPKRPR